jgi:hypothetical protein
MAGHSFEAHAAGERRLDDGLFVLCGLVVGAALIHVEAAVDHLSEYALYAVFFALLAPVQFAWGVALYRRPSRRLLLAGGVFNAAIVALWIVSRTSGLPIGPEHWKPEAIGPIDSIASADELVLALLVGLQLAAPRRGWAPLRAAARSLLLTAGVCLILLSSLSLILNGHAH